jgi:hypothetical protein
MAGSMGGRRAATIFLRRGKVTVDLHSRTGPDVAGELRLRRHRHAQLSQPHQADGEPSCSAFDAMASMRAPIEE